MAARAKSSIKRGLTNLALLMGSLVIFVLFCEFVLFRFILLPSDFEKNAFIDGVIRYEPLQAGYYRLESEIESPFSINAQGWNSRRADYERAPREGITRIAVVGDSYVHAREVPFDQSFAEHLEDRLNAQGETTEVFRFGVKAAPLSQYLQMIRHEVLDYRPDLIIVILIHNDFDESFKRIPGRYTRSFLRLNVENGTVKGEIEPQVYEPGWIDWVSQTATMGYLYHREQIRIGSLSELILGGERDVFQANIDVVETTGLMDAIAAATDYVFARFAELARRDGFDLVLVMDGHRDGIYDGTALEAGASAPLQLNALAAEAAARHGLPFLDLHENFLVDWQANGRGFNFDNDGHWNIYGHELVAAAIAGFLAEQGRLPEGVAQR